MSRPRTSSASVVLSLSLLAPLVACQNLEVGADPASWSTASEDDEEDLDPDDGARASAEGPADEGLVPTAEETGGLVVEGGEGDDPDFERAVAENPGGAAREDVARDDDSKDEVDDAIDSVSRALLSTRGTIVANEARRIAGFTKRSTSYYSHPTYMNESTGTRRADCSGLLGYVLSRKQPRAYELVRNGAASRPTAARYFDYIRARPTSASTISSARWRRILYPRNLKPGDVIAYKYSASSGSSSSGHVMIVKDPPRSGRYREWLVPVVDSVLSRHASDTRGSGDTGPGAGTIGVKVDSAGKPIGYYWRGGISTILNKTTLVFGRIE